MNAKQAQKLWNYCIPLCCLVLELEMFINSLFNSVLKIRNHGLFQCRICRYDMLNFMNNQYASRVNKKWQETGKISNKNLDIENPVINEVVFLGHVLQNPTYSTRQLASISGNTLKINSINKIISVNEYDHRLQFLELMSMREAN